MRACLGPGAVAKHKLEAGMPLTVLGVSVTLSVRGVTFSPDVQKRIKWAARIRAVRRRGRLTSGEASKLAGALQWATQKSFRRLGRAMIRPISRYIFDYP